MRQGGDRVQQLFVHHDTREIDSRRVGPTGTLSFYRL